MYRIFLSLNIFLQVGLMVLTLLPTVDLYKMIVWRFPSRLARDATTFRNPILLLALLETNTILYCADAVLNMFFQPNNMFMVYGMVVVRCLHYFSRAVVQYLLVCSIEALAIGYRADWVKTPFPVSSFHACVRVVLF